MRKDTADHYLIDVVIGDRHEHDRERRANVISPPIDIYEDDQGIFIELEMSGVESSHVKVVWEKGRLVFKGRKKFEKNSENLKYYLLERPYGFFEKTVEIPGNADTDNIHARLKDGVLRVHIPFKSRKSISVSLDENNS